MSRTLTRAAVLVVLLCSVVVGVGGVPLAHASPAGGTLPVRQAGQVQGGSETFTVPCHVRAGRVDTCTIAHTWQTVTTVKTAGGVSTGPDTVIGPGGGGCLSGSATSTNLYRDTFLGLWYWTAQMRWNFDWSNCTTASTLPYVSTTFYDYSCYVDTTLGVGCNPVQNTGVSLFSCPGSSCNGLAHADFYGTYAAGNGWSAFMRTTGDINGIITMPNTINA